MPSSMLRAIAPVVVLAGCATAAPERAASTLRETTRQADPCIPHAPTAVIALGLVPATASSDASPELAALALSPTTPGVRTVSAERTRFVAYAVSDLASPDHVAVVRIEGDHRVPPTKDAVFRVRLGAANDQTMLDVVGLAMSDFDGDHDEDVLLDVRVTTEEDAGSTRLEDVLVVLDGASLATLFEATVDVPAPDPEGLACSTMLERADSDCDGVTDVVVTDTRCHRAMCEGRGPTDATAFRACLEPPEPTQVRYVRDASTGAFAFAR